MINGNAEASTSRRAYQPYHNASYSRPPKRQLINGYANDDPEAESVRPARSFFKNRGEEWWTNSIAKTANGGGSGGGGGWPGEGMTVSTGLASGRPAIGGIGVGVEVVENWVNGTGNGIGNGNGTGNGTGLISRAGSPISVV